MRKGRGIVAIYIMEWRREDGAKGREVMVVLG